MNPYDESVRLAELMGVLSLATDVGTGQPLEHGLRSSVIAVRLGQAAGLDDPTIRTLFYATLLFYIGCTSDAQIVASYVGNEIDIFRRTAPVQFGSPRESAGVVLRAVGRGEAPLQRARAYARAAVSLPQAYRESHSAHCEAAQLLAGPLGLGPDIQACFPYLFELWNGKGFPGRAHEEEVPIAVRAAHIAHDADLHRTLAGDDAALQVLERRSGKALDPYLVGLLKGNASEVFADLDEGPAWDLMLEAEPGKAVLLQGSEIEEALRAFGDFSDLKSPYTLGHSEAVADLAFGAASHCNLGAVEARDLRWAGHLHDLGMVAVPLSAWDHGRALSPDQRESLRLHPYFTERVTARSPALGPASRLASLHHERLDGSGYHRACRARELPMAARLLAAAEAQRSMLETRSHRAALTEKAVTAELAKAVGRTQLDGEAVDAVQATATGDGGRRRHPNRTLTDREVEVLRLIAEGLATKQVARALGISTKTADNHIQHIYAKAGVTTRAAAALYAVQQGLVP